MKEIFIIIFLCFECFNISYSQTADFEVDGSIYIKERIGLGDHIAQNTFIGLTSGSEGSGNTFLGYASGSENSFGNPPGELNSFFGAFSGVKNHTGSSNTFLGNSSGAQNDSGSQNTFIGYRSGTTQVTGNDNVYLGHNAGANKTGGTGNVMIGKGTGQNNGVGNFNIFIGQSAGSSETGSYRLHLGAGATEPLIYGEFLNKFLRVNGTIESMADDGGTTTISLLDDASDPKGFELEYQGLNHELSLIAKGLPSGDKLLMYFEETGEIGINVNDPSGMLDIKQLPNERAFRIRNDGNSSTWSYEIGTNDLNLYFGNTRVGWWDDLTGNYHATSDMRRKKDIEFLSKAVLDKVLHLRPSFYRLKEAADSGPKNFGFIAQEVQVHFPEFIRYNDNGGLGLNYDDFGVLAIKAIQEQQEIINSQKDEIITQNERLKNLENRLDKFEKLLHVKIESE